MIRQTALAALSAALCLLLAGCGDPRRDAVRDYLQSHQPEGFQLVTVPEKFTVVKNETGAESVVEVKYRLKKPTVEIRDALQLPRGEALAKRIAAVRGWALSSLPAGDPARVEITAASAAASTSLPVKRIATPAGAVVDTLAVLTLTRESGKWKVTPGPFDVNVRGTLDVHPEMPLEHAPNAAAQLDKLDALASHLENVRKLHLAERARTAAESLATLRMRLQTGNTFEGDLPGDASARLVVSRGFEEEPVVVVLTVRTGDLSSARYTGTLTQEPTGKYLWRAAQLTTLSGDSPLTDVDRHPILTLSPDTQGLAAEIRIGTKRPFEVQFHKGDTVDLIPEAHTTN